MNKVILGGIVDRIESKQVGENNNSLLTFTVITTSSYMRNGATVESNQYHRAQAWNQNADLYAAQITDGQYVVITGRIQNRSYEQDGVTKWITQIDVEDLDAPGVELATASSNGPATATSTALPF